MNWWQGWGPPPNMPNWGPPTNNYYYPPPPPAPPPPEVKKAQSEWKEFEKFRKSMTKEKEKKKEEKKEKKGLEKITGQEFSFPALVLWIFFLGPIAGKVYNKLEALLSAWIGN